MESSDDESSAREEFSTEDGDEYVSACLFSCVQEMRSDE